MTDRPILFSTEMVQAILEGRKSQTRRVIKPQPPEGLKWMGWVIGTSGDDKNLGAACWVDEFPLSKKEHYAKCPYGQPGDRLWVRETWLEDHIPELNPNEHGCIHYKANGYTHQIIIDGWKGCWRPSIFMPRWASRITLEVVSVRVERVQDISEEDAKAEGVNFCFPQNVCDTTVGLIGTKAEDHGYDNYLWHGNFKNQHPPVDWEHQYSNYKTAKDSYSSLWQLINSKRGYGWDVNPWVWCTEFKRIENG